MTLTEQMDSTSSVWRSSEFESRQTLPRRTRPASRTAQMSDAESLLFYADLEFAAEIGLGATPRVAGLRRCVFSAPCGCLFCPRVSGVGPLAGKLRTAATR